MAVENGYFAVPRETQLEEIADELGITGQAASERVRRATETVLRKAPIGRGASDLDTPHDEQQTGGNMASYPHWSGPVLNEVEQRLNGT